jgi:hypothetical protein
MEKCFKVGPPGNDATNDARVHQVERGIINQP